MMIHNDFIGSNDANISLPFVGWDFKDVFLDNLKKMENDWYYRTASISYNINENGHRSVSIKDLDQDNYILFTGCSHTYGIGLELEKTYSYLLSEKLGCSYYNLAMPATGIDVLEYNLLMWFNKIQKKPKLVIIQMPDHSRYCASNPYVNPDFFIEGGSWATDPDEQKMVVNCEDSGFFNARKILTYKTLANIINVPTVYLNVYGQANGQANGLKMRRMDLARDLSHNGIISNQLLCRDLYEYINTVHRDILTE